MNKEHRTLFSVFLTGSICTALFISTSVAEPNSLRGSLNISNPVGSDTSSDGNDSGDDSSYSSDDDKDVTDRSDSGDDSSYSSDDDKEFDDGSYSSDYHESASDGYESSESSSSSEDYNYSSENSTNSEDYNYSSESSSSSEDYNYSSESSSSSYSDAANKSDDTSYSSSSEEYREEFCSITKCCFVSAPSANDCERLDRDEQMSIEKFMLTCKELGDSDIHLTKQSCTDSQRSISEGQYSSEYTNQEEEYENRYEEGKNESEQSAYENDDSQNGFSGCYDEKNTLQFDTTLCATDQYERAKEVREETTDNLKPIDIGDTKTVQPDPINKDVQHEVPQKTLSYEEEAQVETAMQRRFDNTEDNSAKAAKLIKQLDTTRERLKALQQYVQFSEDGERYVGESLEWVEERYSQLVTLNPTSEQIKQVAAGVKQILDQMDQLVVQEDIASQKPKVSAIVEKTEKLLNKLSDVLLALAKADVTLPASTYESFSAANTAFATIKTNCLEDENSCEDLSAVFGHIDEFIGPLKETVEASPQSVQDEVEKIME